LAGTAGCKATPPGRFESSTITFLKHHLSIRNKSETNPLPDNADTLADGNEAFSHYCVPCHGMDGQATGVPLAGHISPPIPSLASREDARQIDGRCRCDLDYGRKHSELRCCTGPPSEVEPWPIVR